MSIGVNNDTVVQKYQQLSNAVACANMASIAVGLGGFISSWPIGKCATAIMRNLPAKDEVSLSIGKTVDYLNKNNHNLSHLCICDMTDKNTLNSLIKMVKESKKLNWFQKLVKCSRLKTVYKGKDAFAESLILNSKPHTNIYINSKKLPHSFFHEVGHAMNFQTSKFWRFLQKNRIAATTLIPIALLTTALYKQKKAKGEKSQGFFDKATTFIKENVGKLVFLSALPVIAEEAKASLNGQKLAKKILSNKNYKNVVLSNSVGLLSYTLGAVFLGWFCDYWNKAYDKQIRPLLQAQHNRGIQQQCFDKAKSQRRL